MAAPQREVFTRAKVVTRVIADHRDGQHDMRITDLSARGVEALKNLLAPVS